MKATQYLFLAAMVGCSTSGQRDMVRPADAAGAGRDAAGGTDSVAGGGTSGSHRAGAGNETAAGQAAAGKATVAGAAGKGGAGEASVGGASAGGASAGGGPGATAGGSTGGAPGAVKFHEDFSGDWPGQWSLIDRPGDLLNSELGCYKPANATPNAGLLEIKSQVDSSCNGYAYTSGMAQWKSYSFTYGTIEVRAKLAGGKGPWPAIWLLGANCQATNLQSPDNSGTCSWPNPGSDEIDITEMLGAGRTTVNQQVHTASGNPGCSAPVTDTSKNFHTYRLVWRKGSLVWSIDGVTTCTITQSVPTTAMFLLLNTAMGGIGGGAIDAATLPQTSYIDEVTVWQ